MSLEDVINSKLKNYMESSAGKSKVSNYTKENNIFLKNIEKEAEKLKQCIQQEIDNYYSSYIPKVYPSNGDWRNSLIVNTTSDGNIIITFAEDLAFHKSLFGDDEVYVPILMDSGWHWNTSHDVINRFTDFEGLNYIENAINKYLITAPKGIKFTVKQTDFYGQTIEKTYSK